MPGLIRYRPHHPFPISSYNNICGVVLWVLLFSCIFCFGEGTFHHLHPPPPTRNIVRSTTLRCSCNCVYCLWNYQIRKHGIPPADTTRLYLHRGLIMLSLLSYPTGAGYTLKTVKGGGIGTLRSGSCLSLLVVMWWAEGILSFNNTFPPNRHYPNNKKRKFYRDIISKEIETKIAMGALKVLGRVREPRPPAIVMPFSNEPSKPRLVHDQQYLNCRLPSL